MFKRILFLGALAFVSALAFTDPVVPNSGEDSELEYLLYSATL